MIWHPSLTGIISCDFSRLKLKCELGKSKDDGTTGAHGILPKCINWSTIELNLKRKEFSSITFNSASLSRRAMARRWSPIGHCLASLGRIDRHNLEKYFSYSHSFHWHSKREKLFAAFETTFQEQQLIPSFSPVPRFSRPSSREERRDGRRLPRTPSRATTIARTIVRTTGSRLTLWRKLAGCDWPTEP